MYRVLFTTGKRCKAKCKYCFARNFNYNIPNIELLNKFIKTTNHKSLVIYPSCDTEINGYIEYLDEIVKTAMDSKVFLAIGLSSKNNISEKQIKYICNIDKMLKKNKIGFIKLAISLSTKTLIDEIEQGTTCYEERLNLLKQFTIKGIYTNIILKPILPFINLEEYKNIILDVLPLSKNIVIGGLYYNDKSEFYNKYLSKYIKKRNYREVGWLPDKPIWPYHLDKSYYNSIKCFANDNGAIIYESDEEYILHLKENIVKEEEEYTQNG